jgi:hypothetical protein
MTTEWKTVHKIPPYESVYPYNIIMLHSRDSFSPSAPGQSHLIFGTGSAGCVISGQLSKRCYADALYKPLENIDAIAMPLRMA